MGEAGGVTVERMIDDGQWFERGARVEYFPTAPDPRDLILEKAALGSYEVLGCTRVEANGQRWLHIKLRRLLPTERPTS
jgi:hypothetical protein